MRRIFLSSTRNKNRYDLINFVKYLQVNKYKKEILNNVLQTFYQKRNFIEENLKLGRYHSSVCDEINRNSDKNGEYKAFHVALECAKRRVYREHTNKDMYFLEKMSEFILKFIGKYLTKYVN